MIKTYQKSGFIFTTLMLVFSCSINQENNDYKVGDLGPAGGYIFYTRFTTSSKGWHYLEAAPSDVTSSLWGTADHSVPGAEGILPGTGRQNSLDIIDGDSEPDKAVDRCAAYTVINNGTVYDDWFLPSKHELDFMYNNMKVCNIGNLSNGIYWSSSEDDNYDAWCVNFFNGDDYRHLKSFIRCVRPVRAF